MRLTLATHNEHKLSEFARLLPGYEIVGLPAGSEAPTEDGDSFAANALIKARAGAALSGSRWAGEPCDDAANLKKLIDQTEPGDRLEYICAIAYCDPQGGVERVVEGSCLGTRAAEPRGSGGFGYDPAFEPLQSPGRTMAELSGDEKDQISHRGNAVRELSLLLGDR